MKTKVQISLVETGKNLKQPKLSFSTEAKKRKNEDADEKIVKRQKLNKANEEKKVKRKFSNSMKDAVKTECKICRFMVLVKDNKASNTSIIELIEPVIEVSKPGKARGDPNDAKTVKKGQGANEGSTRKSAQNNKDIPTKVATSNIKLITVEDSPAKLPRKASMKLKITPSKPNENLENKKVVNSVENTKEKCPNNENKVPSKQKNESKKFSNSMKDAVKTLCKICRYITLKNEDKSSLNKSLNMGHDDSKKKASTYNKQDMNIDKSFDKKLEETKKISGKEDEKQSIQTKENLQSQVVKEAPIEDEEIDEDDYYDEDDEMLIEINNSMKSMQNQDTSDIDDEDKSVNEDDDDGSGPSSGIRLTEEERENNLFELYKLQRKLLRGLHLTEDDDDD